MIKIVKLLSSSNIHYLKGEKMPQFDLHFLAPLTFWSIISFVILMAILYKYALPAITEILDTRQKTIIDEIDRAEKELL